MWKQRITYPIELVMERDYQRSPRSGRSPGGGSLPGHHRLRRRVDPYFTRQVVFERLQEPRTVSPPGVEPELGPLSTGLGEIFQYTLEGDGFSPMEKRSIPDLARGAPAQKCAWRDRGQQPCGEVNSIRS